MLSYNFFLVFINCLYINLTRKATLCQNILKALQIFAPISKFRCFQFMKPNNHKMRSEVFLQHGQIYFRIFLRQSGNFSDVCKVLSQFAFRNMIALPCEQFHPHLFSPSPLSDNVGHVYTLFFQSFNIVLGGRGGGEATHFKTDNSVF